MSHATHFSDRCSQRGRNSLRHYKCNSNLLLSCTSRAGVIIMIMNYTDDDRPMRFKFKAPEFLPRNLQISYPTMSTYTPRCDSKKESV